MSRSINIKMSDFRGLTKTDPVNNNYIYNSGDGTEEIYTYDLTYVAI